MISSIFSMIAMGFFPGLIHALDADHVMAVSALSSSKTDRLEILRLSAYWVLGHGGVLFLCGILFFGFGIRMPESILYWSELAVGVMLIVLGIFLFRRLQQQKLSLMSYRHGDVVHLHWHVKDELMKDKNSHTHAPVIVGILHGFAGSAPVLALIPILAQDQFIAVLTYLILFSLGLMFAMMIFGLGLGVLQQKLKQIHFKLFSISRYLISITSIVIGVFWIMQAV